MATSKKNIYSLAGFFITITLIVTLIPASFGAGTADSAWPMFRHDNRHTGRSPHMGAQENNLKWTYEANSSLHTSSPALGENGTIYMGSSDDNIYALNPDGTLKWSYKTGGSVKSSPAIGENGTIYVGSYDNNLYAIYENGDKKWSYKTDGNVYSTSTT